MDDSKVFNIAICDDDKDQIEIMKELLAEAMNDLGLCYDIYTFQSGEELLKDIKGIDIVFLDIELPGRNGLDLKKAIYKSSWRTVIVYVTGYNTLVYDAFGINVRGFIKKPATKKEIIKYLQDILVSGKIETKISVTVMEDKQIVISSLDILYITTYKGYSDIFMRDGKKYIVKMSLSQFEKLFEDNPAFIRVHHSYIINMDQDLLIKRNLTAIEIEGGLVIPVARRKRKAVDEKIMEYQIYMTELGL